MNRIALATLILGLTAGCTEAGEEGVLSFIAEDGLLDQWADFAVGTKVTVNVFDRSAGEDDDRTDLTVTSATVDDAAIGVVLGTADNTVQIDVVGTGTSRLDVATSVGDDWVEITAAEPVVLLGENGNGVAYDPLVVVVGGRVAVPYALQDDSGEALVGFGLSGFDFDGELAGTLLPDDEGARVFIEVSGAGEGSVIHPSGESARSVTAVGTEELASIDIGAVRFTGEDENVEGIETVQQDLIVVDSFGSLDDGTRVDGVYSLMSIVSTDPAVCAVEEQEFFEAVTPMVVLKGAGTCELTATLGELTDTLTFTVLE